MNFSENIRILEKIKRFLIEKNKDGKLTGSLINAEIAALENSIQFTNLVLNNIPKGYLQKIINNTTVNNIHLVKEIIKRFDVRNDEDYENVFIDEIKLMPNYKLSYSLIKCNGKKYVILEPKKLARNISEWENWENFNFPVEILKENQNLKKIKEENLA